MEVFLLIELFCSSGPFYMHILWAPHFTTPPYNTIPGSTSVLLTLEEFKDDSTQHVNAQTEAGNLEKKLRKLNISILCHMWSEGLALNIVVELMESLSRFTTTVR